MLPCFSEAEAGEASTHSSEAAHAPHLLLELLHVLPGELLCELLHCLKLLEQAVDVDHRGSRGDALLRLELRIEGLLRSACVIDRIIASCLAIAFSSIFAPLSAFASILGIIPMMLSRSPMFLSCAIWSR